jgi:hypothetical protein
MLKLVTPEAPSAATGAEPRYWAFLSYSHHDKADARRLQKQLETYRVPRRLVGRVTAHGAVPARVAPVFRDRDELHAGADLKASVQDALSRSRWLIVVCTPDAARSPWVNREIIEFKKLHGERRVLALIARGEPFASDMPGREAEECFPPALRRALNEQGLPEGEPLEPIAADMRREGDGPHRAMLKLLAGMLGVAFDDLVRRDVQRRLRWLTALASASAVGVVVFAFLAVMAVQARNEAQHQRQQAEGLIEFMLGDLRKKLEPVGRLEVLDSVGEKALAYYGAQEAEKLDATALGHRSRAMHLIGEIRDLRGQPAEAQKAFEQAAATTAQLLAKSPDDGQRIFDHAQSAFWVGDAAWKRGDGKTAERWFAEYLSPAQALVKKDGANLDWRAEEAFAHVNLGVVRLGTGQAAVALESFRRAETVMGQLMQAKPEFSNELAQNLGWQAAAFEMLGDYENALAQQRRKVALFKAMPNYEKDRTAQRGVFIASEYISRYQLALGRVMEAEATAHESLELGEALVKVDPKNLLWLGDTCGSRLGLAEIQRFKGDRAQAVKNLDAARSCVTLLDGRGALSVRNTVLLRSRLLALTAALGGERSVPDLPQRIDELLKEFVPKLDKSIADRGLQVATELANLMLEQGDLLLRRGERAAAVKAWSSADELLLNQGSPASAAAHVPLLVARARLRLRLGDAEGAHKLVTQISKSSYRHPAYADLLKQVEAARGGGHSTLIRQK